MPISDITREYLCFHTGLLPDKDSEYIRQTDCVHILVLSSPAVVRIINVLGSLLVKRVLLVLPSNTVIVSVNQPVTLTSDVKDGVRKHYNVTVLLPPCLSLYF